MQNEKTKIFIKDAKRVGFEPIRQKGSHLIFVRGMESFSIPATKTEVNGCMAKRLRKEFCF